MTQVRTSAKLNAVLQVELGTEERTYMDNAVQWEQRIHEFETRNVARRREESNHHGGVTISNENESVGQWPNLDEICDSACSH